MYLTRPVQLNWHVPNDDEIDFVIQIFREIVEPTLETLENLFKDGMFRYFLPV
jgi:proteasome activator subunit 4